MLQAKCLLRPFAVVIALFFSFHTWSQSRGVDLTDSTGLRSFAFMNGDTVRIRYDSAYVMNKATFRLYQGAYDRLKKGDPNVKKLIENYESLVSAQDSMLLAKEEYYQQLKTSFDSLASGSRSFLDKTDVNIGAINQSLATATSQLNNIKGLLDSSLEKLKQENRLRFKMAIKGFAVGVGVTSLIFLVTR